MDEKSLQLYWWRLINALLAQQMKARLGGNDERADELEAARQDIKRIGIELGWDTVDALRDVLGGSSGREE